MERGAHATGRRQFVSHLGLGGLGLLVGCGRLPGQVASPPSKIARLGWLAGGSAAVSTDGVVPDHESFQQGLRELGYVEGRNLTIEYRYSEGQPERLPALAAELTRLPLEVIIAAGTPATQAIRQAGATAPIVFVAVSDPVGQGFVASLGRPATNLTGLSDFGVTLSGKRLELLRQTVPGAARVAVLRHVGSPASALEWRATEDAARALGVELLALDIDAEWDLPGAFALAREARAEAVLLLTGPYISTHYAQIVGLATSGRLPTMFHRREPVTLGGLMAYGPQYSEVYRRAAVYVDKILRGAAPAELPVEQPMRFDFTVNLKTAQALGLSVPEVVLVQATEVIQ